MAYEPRPYKIIDIKSYTEDVKLFRVKTNMDPSPGQFFQVSVLGKGESPLASCSNNKKFVDILIRKVGNVTTSLFRMKKGDTLYLRGPYGKGYDIKSMIGKNIILAGGGTGIAPVTSLIDYIEQNRKDFGDVSIFLGFRDEDHILLLDKIEKWRKNFKLFLCLDKSGKKTKSEKGNVADSIQKHSPNIKNTLAILCGPEIMMSSVTNKLNKLGLQNNKILWNMERRMECAIGCCGRCLLADVYVCKDGPVFTYSSIKEKIENEAL